MLKACPYCGRIHDKKADCGKRPAYGRFKKQDAFRSTKAWQCKRALIRERDLNLCRWCLCQGRLEYKDLSVHHIEPLEENWNLRLEDGNLITLCSACHEKAEAGRIPRKTLHELTGRPPELSPPVC